MSKEVQEQWLEQEINKAKKKYIEYKEVDRNNQANKWEARVWLLESILSLVEDGYKYRKLEGGKNTKL